MTGHFHAIAVALLVPAGDEWTALVGTRCPAVDSGRYEWRLISARSVTEA
jgi:hypothetical protein